jgi:glycosyltransferase involved in cell wall biosynthesis
MTTSASPDRPTHQSSLSVLVPAFNEEAGLGPTITQIRQALETTIEDFEILIVNDGSTDQTASEAERLALADPHIRIFHNPRNMGLGYSYLRGTREARKTHFVYVPGDNTWPAASIAEIFRHLGKADVVTSFATNPEVRLAYRRIVSSGYTRLVNLLFGYGLRYYNGLVIYPAAFLRAHPTTTHGFAFQSETLLKALDAGLSVVEVGVPIDESTARRSKAVTIRNILSVLKTLGLSYWRLRIRRTVRPSNAPALR